MTEIIFADNTSPEIREEVLRISQEWKVGTRKLVHNHGINDSDYITWAETKFGIWQCPIYTRWVGMLERVYSTLFHLTRPSYKGIEIHPSWHSFMSFRKWCLDNGWRSDYQLDKDLISNSKIYGPDTCSFIPSTINLFITDSGRSRGSYPIGVSKLKNKFISRCCNPFTKCNEYLGLFYTPEEAHAAWKQKKHEHALALANTYPDLDPRVLQSLRTRYQ